ncbi:hypothetical protein [Fulvivirga sp.]|uniref:hypothetical protein n=1 Tax=Fulvivirga sp. TaxID=1931237 RepID=UPI0032EE2901
MKKETLLQRKEFGEFIAVNSVRENRKNWIEDQYQVSRFHRLFGMDSYIFTGEEIVTNIKGPFFKLDPSIPHDEYPNDKVGFNPSRGAGKFNFDKFLTQMKANGLESIPVLARNLLYNNVPDDSVINVWQIPYDNNGDPEEPLDYKAYASFLYQFAARYGKNGLIDQGGTIDPRLLKLTDDNELKAGLDLIHAIEPGNEMDREWFSEREYASPKVLAAFLSAAIDGHMGLMGPGHGILSADPTMKILLPSPTEIKEGYVIDVLKYLKQLRVDAPIRGYEIFPENNFILTAHTYPFDESKQAERSTTVENTSIFKKSYNYIKRLRRECDCPIYLTETGYDKVTGEHSPIGVPVNDNDFIDSLDVSAVAHAKHILRLMFTTYAAGFDKTFLFTLKDPIPVGGKNYRTKFATTGLTRKNGIKDLAWYDVKFLSERLNDHHLTWAFLNQPINFLLMENPEEYVLVYWLGTNSNARSDFKLPQALKSEQQSELIDLSNRSEDQGIDIKCINLSEHSALSITEFPQLLIIPK